MSSPDIERLSLNQMTTERWSLREAVEGCARAGIRWIGLWRHKVAETGLVEASRLVRDSGIAVSSLCRGGMFPAATAAQRRARIDDNRRAIDEAVELGAGVLVLVCGPAPDRDIDGARAMVEDGIGQLIPYAAERGVKLGIEPLHPAFAADRSAIVTLGQAGDMVARLDSPQAGGSVPPSGSGLGSTLGGEVSCRGGGTVTHRDLTPDQFQPARARPRGEGTATTTRNPPTPGPSPRPDPEPQQNLPFRHRDQTSQVGVVVDVYHVWWDPELYAELERARGHILGFHVNDWLAPNADPLMGRGMMGDGVIELRRIRKAVDAAGYGGPIEVEIFNRVIWDTPGIEVLERMKQRYLEYV